MYIRLMSHNLWKCDTNSPQWEAMGMDCSVEARAVGFASVYEHLKPDVIGCQEMSPKMSDILMRSLAEDGVKYALLWGRDTPIIYRQDRLELVDSDFFVYPENVPGIDGEFNNVLTKSYSVAVFRIKDTGKKFAFMSTHLWWMSDDLESEDYRYGSGLARVYQLGTAIEKLNIIREDHRCPAVLVGDFNAEYDTPVLQYAFDRGFVHAHDIASDYADDSQGYHECGKSGFSDYLNGGFRMAIDHILVRGDEGFFVRRFERYSPKHYLPLSDHSPVFADIEVF